MHENTLTKYFYLSENNKTKYDKKVHFDFTLLKRLEVKTTQLIDIIFPLMQIKISTIKNNIDLISKIRRNNQNFNCCHLFIKYENT